MCLLRTRCAHAVCVSHSLPSRPTFPFFLKRNHLQGRNADESILRNHNPFFECVGFSRELINGGDNGDQASDNKLHTYQNKGTKLSCTCGNSVPVVPS